MQTDYPVAQELLDLADVWPTYPSKMTSTATRLYPPITRPCNRCTDCDGALYPAGDRNAVLRHLIEQHGYRMDGTRKEP